MKLLALLILVTIPAEGDYNTVADDLRRWAKAAGCERPVIERISHEESDEQELLVRCREVENGRD